ncbi:hypothetical protein [Streptomyces acidiscabies]|uniref:Uncharacterized protein n=1 Tax=Streptomyces acidiscabies TaxID=42234 RepID=A0AAP6BCV1_9ACTN|nr:hypothetical protein [Streptomyces acidiscabies]MBZ3909419.1 hypothetical protein [Streptomyces acidiscabies]MDX2962414.1 hypothetical protein [Streptomyces acidiscabies]MDX3792433.1 hypothetical protein [Streptomyces acidiscabies]
MATTRKTTEDETEQPNPAAVRTQEYPAGVGWQIGQTAPDDAFRALDAAGTGEPTGPVVHTHPGGYARQIAVKDSVITTGVRRELDAAEAESAEG